MRPIVQEIATAHSPESLLCQLESVPGRILLRSGLFDLPQVRYSLLTANPFLTFRSYGSRCETITRNRRFLQFGNPWHQLERLMARYELLDEVDLPFPLGGCFGFWGYDLKNFVEPKLIRTAVDDLELPDCRVGFYDSLVVFDHRLGKSWVVSTGLQIDGSRDKDKAVAKLHMWKAMLESNPFEPPSIEFPNTVTEMPAIRSTSSREAFVSNVQIAKDYIRAGDIYQVNLSHRLSTADNLGGAELYRRLLESSPAPYAAYLDCGGFEVVSSSPESFLRLSGRHVRTRPIKGTRPRSPDQNKDAQLTYELQTSPKEMAELVMITDLLRNDLGKVCEFGSVQVPELVRLERYPQVQHLVSTVEGTLRQEVTHLEGLASCFPGGSVSGAPKIRAMEIIDQLESVNRGPYTGCIGYLGFNRESQLNIAIRTAIITRNRIYFHVGAGIVADSDPEAEYQETMHKAAGFLNTLNRSFHASRSGRINLHPEFKPISNSS